MSTKISRPQALNAGVMRLCQLHNLSGSAKVVPYTDYGYQKRMCHISAKHHAMQNGGRRIHGWAIWKWTQAATGEEVIVAEHHSVWENPDGKLIDVTPPADGGNAVLFVRDDTAVIKCNSGYFQMHSDLTDIPGIRMLAGNQCFDATYSVSLAKADLVAYANRLGFDVSAMATDSING